MKTKNKVWLTGITAALTVIGIGGYYRSRFSTAQMVNHVANLEDIIESKGKILSGDNLDGNKKLGLMFSTKDCAKCPEFKMEFEDKVKKDYSKRIDDIGFAILESESLMEDQFLALKQTLGIGAVPNYVIGELENGNLRVLVVGDNNSTFKTFERDVDKYIYGISPSVINPRTVIDALLLDLKNSRFMYDGSSGVINVEWNLTNAEEIRAALRNDSLITNNQRGMFLEASMSTTRLAMERGVDSFNEDITRYLVGKYLPDRIKELSNPETVQDVIYWGSSNKPSLYDILHDGALNSERKSRFDDEISDRILWYGLVCGADEKFIPDRIKPIWDAYVNNQRNKFLGLSGEYEINSETVSDEFKEQVEKWALTNGKVIRYFSFPSEKRIDDLLDHLSLDDKARLMGKHHLLKTVAMARDFYQRLKEACIVYVPEDTPKKILEEMIRGYDVSVVARASDNQLWNDTLIDLAEKNKESVIARQLGIFYLGGTPYKLGRFPPLDVGIHSVTIPYLMYSGYPAAAVFKNNGSLGLGTLVGTIASAQDLKYDKIFKKQQ